MENIKHLQKLAEVFDTDKIITSDEIEQVLKGILVIMNSFKKDNQTLNKETKEVVEILLNKVLTENAKLKETVNRETSDQKEDFAKQVKELKDLVSKVQTIKPIDGVDGKDADEEKIVEDVLAKIKLPEYEVYTLEEKGEDIVAEINALPLEDEYKIDASHIKNLPESKGGTFNGGGWRNLYQLHDVELSSPTDNQVLTYDSTSNTWKNENSAGGGGAWGTITGTLSDQTDLQTALDTKVDENVAITGATKTKITYDAKGLVTAGADATTADIADSSNKRYVTDAQLTVIGNTSGTNTGDQDLSSYLTSATAASTYEPLRGGDDNYVTSAQLTIINNTSGTNTGDQDLSGLVPYTGATGDVNLGTYGITIGSGIFKSGTTSPILDIANLGINDASSNNVISIANRTLIDSTSLITMIDWSSSTGIKLGNTGGIFATLDVSDLTTGRTFTFPDADGILALTSDISALSSVYQPLDTQLTSLAGLSYTGNAGKFIRVNAGETDFELATVGGSGTVTSVDMSVPTGLTVSGNPITTTGTLAVALDTGYVIPLQTTLDGYVKTDQTVGQTIGATSARLTKLWATDITVTNAIAGSITGNAGTVTNGLYTTDVGSVVQAYDADLTTWAGITPGTGVGTALAVNVGTAGAFVVNGGALGTPSSGTVTNLTGTASININGTVGATTPTTVKGTTIDATTGFKVNSAATSNTILKGNGTNFVQSTETYASPGTSGNVMTSDGTNWISAAPAGGGGGGTIFALGKSSSVAGASAIAFGETAYGDTYSFGAIAETDFGIIATRSGTLKNLYVGFYANDLDASLVFTLRINGSDTTITATRTSGSTATISDTTHTVSVSAGDVITIKGVVAGSSGTANPYYSFQLD